MDKMTDTDDIDVVHRRIPNLEDMYSSETDDSDDNDNKLNAAITKSLLEEAANCKTKLAAKEEIARKFAVELLAEEEKEKSKAKKKAKKKKRKEKKKMEKEMGSPKPSKKQSSPKKTTSDLSNNVSEEEDLDPDSAFVAAAACKKVVNYDAPVMEAAAVDTKKISTENEEKKNDSELISVAQQAKDAAIRGNEIAKLGQFKMAASLFTQAIKLDPADFRFYGNRSYCYELTNHYDKALSDAEIVIAMAPKWPKGYFRKGRALIGLARYSEAEEAFEQVLKRDKNCPDAMQELKNVRMMQIKDMGFTETQAEEAIEKHGNIAGAVESLLGSFVDPKARKSKPCPSPVKRVNPPVPPPPVRAEQKTNQTNQKNQKQYTSVWVGNVLPDVNDKQLAMLFSRYGPVQSVKMIPDKYCAFVDYKDVGYAEKAMTNLQGYELMGQHLAIRFPDNPIVFSGPQQNLILRKGTLRTTETNSRLPSSTGEEPKKNGPVNGNECYYWRTTGCAYGNHCRNVHVPANKGIDRKPWHKLPVYSS